MLVVLVVLLGAYELVTHLRTDLSRGGMEVVVGSNLMACIDPADIPGETPLLDALEEVAVRPASRQVLVLTGPELNIGNPVRQKMSGAMSVGHSMYDHYAYVYEGINDNGEALYRAWYDPSKGELGAVLPNNERNYITSLHQWLLENPDKTEKDLTYEKTTNASYATLQYTGQSYLPDLDGGFGIDLEAYGLTLSASCPYRIGGFGYDYTYMALMDDGSIGGHSWHVDMLNSWSEFNTNTEIPKLTNGMGDYASFTNMTSTRFLTSNSYFSLNDVQIGYNFPKKLIEKIKLNRLNIYVSATNLAIATARKGYNPMTSFTGSSDTHGYSPLSTIMGGIKLSF